MLLLGKLYIFCTFFQKMPSVTCRSVTHSQQRFNWDCGLACILMALDAADELEAKDRISSDLEKVCQNEGFGHSTWTIDLAYLLKNFAPQLKFSYTTITIGVDQSYMNQVCTYYFFVKYNFVKFEIRQQRIISDTHP